jgi:2-polyprenyl-3-methyl-5-hydroxy-6-metoxy-1,4-benzoquinol methylase
MFGYFLPDMRARSFEPELMDMPDADVAKLLKTVRQFSLINRLFSSSRSLLREKIFPLMKKDSTREYSLLDIGAGGCDIAVWIAREARRRSIKLRITVLDSDERILPVMKGAVKELPEIKIVHMSAFEIERLGMFDFICSNHFMHHLDWQSLAVLLSHIRRQTRIAFLMNDLRRSIPGFIGYTIFAGLFLHRSFAFYDGRLSIRRGFTKKEMDTFLKEHLPDAVLSAEESGPARLYLFGSIGKI